MIVDKAYVRLNVPLIDYCDLGDVVIILYEKDILHFIAKSDTHVNMEVLERIIAHIDRLGKKKYYLITEFEEFADSSSDVREWKVGPESEKYKYAEAVVITSFAQKIVANFYLAFNKPPRPTRVFNKLEDAEKWILKCIENKKSTSKKKGGK